MFQILKKAAQTGLVTIGYPDRPAQIPANFRGAPSFEFSGWQDAWPAADACPTGAISIEESEARRRVTIDYGLCIYCGQCAEADSSGAVKITRDFELAPRTQRSCDDCRISAQIRWAPGRSYRFARRLNCCARSDCNLWNRSFSKRIHDCWVVRWQSGKSTRVRAMAAKSKSTR